MTGRPGARIGALPLATYGLILGIGVFWGLNWPAVKILLTEMEPWGVRATGLTCGGMALLALARLWGHSLAVPLRWIPVLIPIALLNIFAFNILTAHAQLVMDASRAAIVAFTMPVWASLLAAFLLGERLSGRRILALALGMAGLAVLIGPEIAALGRAPLGAVLVLLAALAWASGTVLMKRARFPLHVLVLAGWQVTISAVPAVIGALVLEGPPALTALSAPVAGVLLFHILGPMVFCHFAWFGMVSRLPAGVAAIGSLLVPVVGVLGSAVILGEAVGPAEILALVLVLSAVATVLIRPEPPPSGPRPVASPERRAAAPDS